METVDKETGEILNFTTGGRYPPKGKGSFWITRKAIAILIGQQATAMDICAYLVLAKHTDEGGQFSTSGIQAIYKAVGVGHAVAEKAVARLCQMGLKVAEPPKKGKRNPSDAVRPADNPTALPLLVYQAEEWATKSGQSLPVRPTERSKVRWVVNDYGATENDRVWISNELVDGFGRFTQPLKRLKRCGDLAARLLLVCYAENDLEQYGGIRPRAEGTFFDAYTMQKIKPIAQGYDLWHGVHKQSTGYGVAGFLGLSGFSSDEDKKQEQIDPYWRAIESLDAAGFTYQVVTVMDREAGNDEGQVIYELDTKSRHGFKPQGEHGLGGATASLSHQLGNPVADAQGRLYGRYAVIVPSGVKPHVVGIYRLRFRVANPKNHTVKGAWARIYQGQKEAQEWLEEVASREKLELHGVEQGNKKADPQPPKPPDTDANRVPF